MNFDVSQIFTKRFGKYQCMSLQISELMMLLRMQFLFYSFCTKTDKNTHSSDLRM